MFTYPPIIDIGNSSSNKYIQSVLGDAYAKNCKKLCVNSANAGIAWVHYWIDDKNRFRWAVIDSKEIIPVYNNDLEKKLISDFKSVYGIRRRNRQTLYGLRDMD